MSRATTALDPIIRKLEKKEQPSDGSVLLIFDEKSKTLLSKEPSVLQQISKRIGYYRVHPGTPVKCESLPISLDNLLAIDLDLTARCPIGNEAKVLASLYEDDRSFETVLQEKLRLYTREALSTAPSLKSAAQLLEYLRDQVAIRCLRETGLLITPDLHFQDEQNLRRFTLKGGPLAVRVKDYDNNLSLDYDLEVAPGEGQWELALKKISSTEVLKDKLKEIIVNTISRSATLDQFCFSLNIGGDQTSIRDLLVTAMEELLALEGRTVSYLQLASSSIDNILPPASIEIDHTYSYKLADEDLKVEVKSDVTLYLTSISAYKRAEQKMQIKNGLKNWFTESVITFLVKKVLFEKLYVDLLEDPGAIKELIQEEILARTSEMGYRIVQHTHLPNIDKLKLEKEFVVEINEEFETNNTSVRIKLFVNIRGKIGRLKNLDDRLLHPNVVIPDEMRADIRSIIKEQIHQLDPERIYMHFDTSTDYTPVRELLIEQLTVKFNTKYNAQGSLNIIVNFDEKDDQVFKKAKELQERDWDVTVTAYPSTMEPIEFKLFYKIIRVNKTGWYLFQTRIGRKVAEEIIELNNALTIEIEKKIDSLPYAQVMSDNYETKLLIDKNIFKPSLAYIGAKSGFDLDFVTSKRNRTASEISVMQDRKRSLEQTIEARNNLRQLEFQSTQKQITDLAAKKSEASLMGDEADAQQAAKEIKELTASIIPGSPGGDDLFTQLQEVKKENTGTMNLLDPPSNNP